MCDTVLQRLLDLRDEAYKSFQCPLIPTVAPERVIGVRIPLLRRLAKKIAGTPEADAFMRSLPHAFFEEDNLHALLIEQIHDYDQYCKAIDAFLPFMDNWATCDTPLPKVLSEHLPELRGKVKNWLCSEHPYTVRYGVNALMKLYLNDAFEPIYLDWVADVDREEYYIRMAVAWYFATALTFQYEAALPYLEKRKLAPWVHQKTIQKAVESYRIPAERKAYLKGLRIKRDRG